MSKRGQVAVFVIIAVVIVGLIASFFIFRSSLGGASVPGELQPVFSYYTECISRETKGAASLLELQGGRIDTGVYVPGNDYAPFSSQLNFLGTYVPYWYFLSDSNAVKENVPTKASMEKEMADFIASQLQDQCSFSSFSEQGFDIESGVPSVRVTIADNNIRTNVDSAISVSKNGLSATQRSYIVDTKSKLGAFYKLARDLYDKELSEAFLENYAVDVLRFYAPVDGVEVQCSPKIWETGNVVSELKAGIDTNFEEIKFRGNYYTQTDVKKKYYQVDLATDYAVRVLTSSAWPSKVEITPADNALMMAEPIGNQEGLGVMGFCYVPYHFVYDLSFPAMFQIYDGEEVFQFPVVVIVDKNQPRDAFASTFVEPEAVGSDVCAFKTNSVSVSVFDANLGPVVADVSYQCFDQSCSVGKTVLTNGKATVTASVPACVNGYLVVNAEGYATKKQVFSSNRETNAEVILDKLNSVDVNVLVDGKPTQGSAIVHFTSDDGSVSALIPGSSNVRLKEGLYNVSVYVYGNSSIVIPGSTKQECTKVAVGGVFGLFGGTEDKCFNVNVPETKIDYALRGGGTTSAYFFDSELLSGRVNLYVSSLPAPTSLEDLQNNFEVVSESGVEYSFI